MAKRIIKVTLINLFIMTVAIGSVMLIANIKNKEIESIESEKKTEINRDQGLGQEQESHHKAPNFTAIDSMGNTQTLSQYRGKIVVLEWKNHLCPFVQKHYQSHNMQQLQKKITESGGIWLSIISSAPGKQGHVLAEECNEIIKKEGSQATAVLLDETGEIGRAYQAKTTPHMYVINQEGVLVYQGAIDSIRSADPDDINKATNFVLKAINKIENQQVLAVQETEAYGCGIKY